MFKKLTLITLMYHLDLRRFTEQTYLESFRLNQTMEYQSNLSFTKNLQLVREKKNILKKVVFFQVERVECKPYKSEGQCPIALSLEYLQAMPGG